MEYEPKFEEQTLLEPSSGIDSEGLSAIRFDHFDDLVYGENGNVKALL